MKSTKDIASHLSYSEKLSGLAAGHQKETAQLLEEIEQLQDDAHTLLAENERLCAENKQKDARIAELEARVAKLEARPQFQVEQFVETQNVKKQVVSVPRIYHRKKQAIDLTNQYSLWDPSALSL